MIHLTISVLSLKLIESAEKNVGGDHPFGKTFNN